MNGSTKLKTASSNSSAPPDPLDRAREALVDAKEARKLLEYSDDFEEDTNRHEVTVNLQAPHPPQPSQPQIEVTEPAPGVLKVVFTVVQKFPAWGAVMVALAAIAAYVILKLRGAL
jgi:hypothetical protein